MWTQRDAVDFVPANKQTDGPASNPTPTWFDWLPHLMVLSGIVLMLVAR